MPGKFELFTDSAGKFRFPAEGPQWRDHRQSAAYETKASAKNGIKSVQRNTATATIDDQDLIPRHTVNVATTAAWSDGRCSTGVSVIDGSGVTATVSTVGRLVGLTSRWEAKMWSISSVRHEAPCDRVGVKGLHCWAVAAA